MLRSESLDYHGRVNVACIHICQIDYIQQKFWRALGIHCSQKVALYKSLNNESGLKKWEFPNANEYDSEVDLCVKEWQERDYQVTESGLICPKGQHCTVAIANYALFPLGYTATSVLVWTSYMLSDITYYIALMSTFIQ